MRRGYGTHQDRLFHVFLIEEGMVDAQHNPVEQGTVKRLGHGVAGSDGLWVHSGSHTSARQAWYHTTPRFVHRGSQGSDAKLPTPPTHPFTFYTLPVSSDALVHHSVKCESLTQWPVVQPSLSHMPAHFSEPLGTDDVGT